MIFARVEGDELREVELNLGPTNRKRARFHKWTYSRNLQVDMALVEMEDGTMQYVNAMRVRFIQDGERKECDESTGVLEAAEET